MNKADLNALSIPAIPNRFGVIPTPQRLQADRRRTGKGITIAFLDSGFYAHPDLLEPENRILTFVDICQRRARLTEYGAPKPWDWHGTQTSVVAAGNGVMSGGIYRGLAPAASVVLVKVGALGRIREEDIARGLQWVLDNHRQYQIRVVNISLGGDEILPLEQSPVDQLAEEVVAAGIVVVAASGNTGCGPNPETRPPANAPNVVTVGGYDDFNSLVEDEVGTYCSSFGVTPDGIVKPEVVAPAIWIAAPILPDSDQLRLSSALSQLSVQPDFVLEELVQLQDPEELLSDRSLLESWKAAGLGTCSTVEEARRKIEDELQSNKIVAPYYQHVDGTSFAAPIVSSVVAQMLEANPRLTPRAVKHLLIASAMRISDAPLLWQGYGMVRARRAVELAENFDASLPDRYLEPPRVERGKVIFRFFVPDSNQVSLVGDFNGWDPRATPMVNKAEGVWKVEISIPPKGRYGYKFLIDGTVWCEDPANGLKEEDGHGGFNSILNLS